MIGLFILLFVAFFFGGIYCTFTGRITLYCGSHDLWSLFFGVIIAGSILFLNMLAFQSVTPDSIFFGVPFAIAAVSFLYNMYMTFKENMMENKGIFFSLFAVLFKAFLLTGAILIILKLIGGTKGRR